jgi:hypothetical protein
MISAALYISSAWSDASISGDIRTDLWGVVTDGTTVTNYPVVGCTNYGDTARYRIWDDTAGIWIDLALPVLYDEWTNFGIALTASSIVYTINGCEVAALTNIGATNAFQEVIMQASPTPASRT